MTLILFKVFLSLNRHRLLCIWGYTCNNYYFGFFKLTLNSDLFVAVCIETPCIPPDTQSSRHGSTTPNEPAF